jgi:hypothetical protein
MGGGGIWVGTVQIPVMQAPIIPPTVMHVAPSVIFVNTHVPLGELQAPVWQGSGGGHAMAAPGTQLPPLHLSPTVHPSPSEHEAPSLFWVTQPAVALHVATRHELLGCAHMTAAPPPHVPAMQVSPVVHAFASLHMVPSAETGHVPPGEMHVPAGWQVLAGHVTGLEPVHAPLLQEYARKQRSVPVHVVPSVFGDELQPVFGSQPAVMQGLFVLHVIAGLEHLPEVGSHVPAVWHASAATQGGSAAATQVPA